MKHAHIPIITLVTGFFLAAPVAATVRGCSEILNFQCAPLAQEGTIDLCREYQGKMIMVVNSASKCGYT